MKRPLRWHFVIFVFFFAGAGCSKSNAPAVSATPQPTPPPPPPSVSSPAVQDEAASGAAACSLLTKEEIEAVQGEPTKATKASQKTSAGLTVSQCYFELPTTVNSIVLSVTLKAISADGRDPKQNWQEIFHREHASARKAEEEEKEPQKIDDIGDEAFWIGNRVGGALYVLKGNSYIRISVGGAGDQAQKTEKSKALAQSALKRL